MWSGMLDWIKKSGFTVAKEWSIDLAGYHWPVINEINTYAGSNHYIVTLVSASMLDGGSSSGTTLIPDHWIVWTDKLRDVQGKPIISKSDPWTYVSLELFSWGKNQQQVKSTIQLASFCRRIYFAVAIKRDHF